MQGIICFFLIFFSLPQPEDLHFLCTAAFFLWKEMFIFYRKKRFTCLVLLLQFMLMQSNTEPELHLNSYKPAARAWICASRFNYLCCEHRQTLCNDSLRKAICFGFMRKLFFILNTSAWRWIFRFKVSLEHNLSDVSLQFWTGMLHFQVQICSSDSCNTKFSVILITLHQFFLVAAQMCWLGKNAHFLAM